MKDRSLGSLPDDVLLLICEYLLGLPSVRGRAVERQQVRDVVSLSLTCRALSGFVETARFTSPVFDIINSLQLEAILTAATNDMEQLELPNRLLNAVKELRLGRLPMTKWNTTGECDRRKT